MCAELSVSRKLSVLLVSIPFFVSFSSTRQTMADATTMRQLKIKTSTLVRNLKDLRYCQAEVEKETKRLEEFQATDPEKVSQQKKVIAEADMMVPDALNRIRRATDELTAFLAEHDEIEEGEELSLAKDTLKQSDAVLGKDE